MTPREQYATAGSALRKALERAVTMDEDLKPRDYRVLFACAVLTTSYSRTADTTSVGQVAKLCGLSYARTSESLVRLDDAGVIVWRGTRTRGASGASYVSLIGAAHDSERLLKRRMGRPLTSSSDTDEGDEACPF